MRFTAIRPALALAAVLLAGCDDGTDPSPDEALEFSREVVSLGAERTATIVVRNPGSVAVGPIQVAAGAVTRAGLELPGVAVQSTPEAIPTLNPGDSAIVSVSVTGAEGLQAGSYSAELAAVVQQSRLANARLTFEVGVPPGLVGSVDVTGLPDGLRQGDVVRFAATVYDTLGQVLPDATVTWRTLGAAGVFGRGGAFVPYSTGPVSIVATSGAHSDTVVYDVEPRGLSGSFEIIGNTEVSARFTSDLWVHGSHALTGTWGFRGEMGDAVYVWDVSGPVPVLTDTIKVNARTIDDVMIRADGALAAITHEYMQSPEAITLLDMSDPAHPTIAGEYHSDEPVNWIGVHNVWLEGDYAYIVVDGVASNRGLWILDISDPANPVRVSRFYGGTSFLHDVIVRDGLAFLSHWDDGLIILDVGHGIRGGSPENPVEVSRIITAGAQVHNAWYWPEGGYVFVGEEDFTTPGRLHVVDLTDLENPVQVASMRIQGDTPHNYWMDEENEILYTSWYSRGVQAVDVSGELMGSLELQGRVIANLAYGVNSDVNDCPGGDVGISTCAWGPQLHDGYLYVADMNSGIWKLVLHAE